MYIPNYTPLLLCLLRKRCWKSRRRKLVYPKISNFSGEWCTVPSSRLL